MSKKCFKLFVATLMISLGAEAVSIHQFQDYPQICRSCEGTWSSGAYPITCSSGHAPKVQCADRVVGPKASGTARLANTPNVKKVFFDASGKQL